MHDVLRQRLMRAIESLPDERIYQVLDYVEFLESRYGERSTPEPGGLQRFAERLEDRIRARSTLGPGQIREAFQLLSAADRVLTSVSSAGRELLEELGPRVEPASGRPPVRRGGAGDAPGGGGSEPATALTPRREGP